MSTPEAEALRIEDLRDAATTVRERLIEALSTIGAGDDPHNALCEALAAIDTVLRELPEASNG